MRITKDIETALYEALSDNGYSASAHAVPSTLGHSLPHVHVVRTGGYAYDLVIESHNVDFDIYADDEATAMETACELCGWVREFDDCYRAEITTLPYGNPDPRHPSIARATFKAQIITRVKGA